MRERDRPREIFQALIDSTYSCNSQVWARLKPATRNSSTGAIFHCQVPRCISREQDWK